MLETIFGSTVDDTLTLWALLANLGTALLLGWVISMVYLRTHKAESYSSGFTVSLIILPAIISVIIMLIGNNIARAFSLAGAFSLIRFRSSPGDSKDITYVFFTLAVGLGCGMGYLAFAAVVTVVMSLVMILLHRTNFAVKEKNNMQLKITIPEDLNYSGLFDEILDQYTTDWELLRVKTTDFGTLFQLEYAINLKSKTDSKKFIDELRCRNGNLNINLTMRAQEEKVYM